MSMELRTYTRLWTVEKRLYKVYDFTLPMPVSIRMVSVVFLVGLPWIVLLKVLGVPFSPPIGYLAYLAPPAVIAWYANRPGLEGKRLVELLASQTRFAFQPKFLARLQPFRAPQHVEVVGEVWHLGQTPTRDATPALDVHPLLPQAPGTPARCTNPADVPIPTGTALLR